MKKIALVIALGLALQAFPSKGLASGPPPPTAAGAVVGLALLGFDPLGLNLNKPSAKKTTGDEFADLNNNPNFTDLLKQQAGGSLNTLDILN